MGIGFALTNVLFMAVAYLLFSGVGIWGIDVPVMWGFAIVNFVWWIGIGHAGTLDLGDPAVAQAGVADLDQPVRRGDDPLRRGLRRPVPAPAPGPALGLLLAAAVSQHDGDVAAVAQPADLGRLRRLDVCHRLAPVLVRRADPRPGDPARPGEEQVGAIRLRHPGDGLARLGAALGALPDRLPAPGRAGHAAGRLGALGRLVRLHGRHRPRLALDDLPAVLRRRGDLLRVRDGA